MSGSRVFTGLKMAPSYPRTDETSSRAPMPVRSSESRYFATKEGVKLHSLHWSGAIDASPTEVDDNAVDLPPTILLHGGGANAHWWDHLAPTLAKEGPVFALDFRGHGDSDFPSDREVGAFNVDLEEMLNWLGRKDVHLIGHSLGAAVAFDHASRHPQTRSISLIDLARGSTKGSGRRARLALALRRTYLSRAEAIERFRFLPESSQHNEELRRRIAQMSVREEPDGRFGYKFDGAWFGLPSRPRPDPGEVSCPTLLIRGCESHLLSASAGRKLVEALPQGQFIEIPEAGHHVLIDQPDELLRQIARFRDSIRYA